MTTLITTTVPGKWEDLEELVKDILSECGMSAQRQASVRLLRGSANVDVLAEEIKDGTTLRTICECKNWNTNIPQDVVHAFRTVVVEAGAHRGYIISKQGFQSGAVEASQSTNIHLVTFAEFQKLYFHRWILARSWQLEKTVGSLNTYYEPFGIPGIMQLPTEPEREAYAAVWNSHLGVGLILQLFGPYLRSTAENHPWPSLPIDLSKLDGKDIKFPADLQACDSYREFLQMLEAYTQKALAELRAMNPITRDRSPEDIDRDD